MRNLSPRRENDNKISSSYSSSVSRSAVSDSLQPHEVQPSRLLHPWDSPSKNTGVDCHFLLQGIFLIQGSNPSLLHCWQIFYHLSYREDLKQQQHYHGSCCQNNSGSIRMQARKMDLFPYGPCNQPPCCDQGHFHTFRLPNSHLPGYAHQAIFMTPLPLHCIRNT